MRTGQTAPPFLRAPQQSLGRSSSMLPSRVGATGACVGLFFFGLSYSMWDLSSPPWDGILPPALGAQSRNHWITGEVPSCVGLSGSVPSPSHECLNVLTHTHIHTHTHTHTHWQARGPGEKSGDFCQMNELPYVLKFSRLRWKTRKRYSLRLKVSLWKMGGQGPTVSYGK